MIPLFHGHVTDASAAVLILGVLWGIGVMADRGEEWASRLQQWADSDGETYVDPVAREAFVDDEISLDEYERRVAMVLEPESSNALEVLVEADGIGRERALLLAEEFGSVESLADHTPTEVADRVDGIGDHLGEVAVEAARERR